MTEIQRLTKIMVLKDLLKEYELLARYNDSGIDYDRYCALGMVIKELEQKPKIGHWVDDNGELVPMENGEPIHSCSCSNCGKWLVASDEYGVMGHYCPNCGAKMESGDGK